MWENLFKRGIKFDLRAVINLTKPDAFIEPNYCIYVDGCYWHGCTQHYPSGKYVNNTKKDNWINQQLISRGYVPIRIWEHDIVRRTTKNRKSTYVEKENWFSKVADQLRGSLG